MLFIPHLIGRTQGAKEKFGEGFLFFREGDHHLRGPGRQGSVAGGIPEYMQAEIVPGPALLYTASGQQDLRVLPNHIPGLDPDHRTVAAALILMAQEIPARRGPGRIFLCQIQKHPGSAPVTGLAVNTAQEPDHTSPQLGILHPAAGKEILSVAVGILLLARKAGGKILRCIISCIPDCNASQFPAGFRMLAAQDQKVHAVQTRDQIPVAAQGDLIDQTVRLQKPVIGRRLLETEINIEAHQLQLQKLQFPSLPAAHLPGRAGTMNLDRNRRFVKRSLYDHTAEIPPGMQCRAVDRDADCEDPLALCISVHHSSGGVFSIFRIRIDIACSGCLRLRRLLYCRSVRRSVCQSRQRLVV